MHLTEGSSMQMRILGVIPARGGSKGIPGKNLVVLAGKPLIEYTFEAVGQSKTLARTVVSTDDLWLPTTQRGLEVPFMRPANLAADDAPMLGVLVCHRGDGKLGSSTEAAMVSAYFVSAAEHTMLQLGDGVRSDTVSVVEVLSLDPVSLMRERGRLVAYVGGDPVLGGRTSCGCMRNGPAILLAPLGDQAGNLYGLIRQHRGPRICRHRYLMTPSQRLLAWA
jgi:hypothetical protein